MFFYQFGQKPTGGIYDWLLANKEAVRAGTAKVDGIPVDENTEFYQFQYVISIGIGTLINRTEHFLTPTGRYPWTTAWFCTFVTLVFGWWCFPWGPPFTIMAIGHNLSGGGRRTAESLLQLIEWGWDAPRNASSTNFRKNILEILKPAENEIRSRMQKGGFSVDLAVRLTPTKWMDEEVEICFDYPVSDGSDWVDESQNLTLLIEKKHESIFAGKYLTFEDGKFRLIEPTERSLPNEP